MPAIIGVPGERADGESRVAMTPEIAAKFSKIGASVLLERGAGTAARMPDEHYGDAVKISERSNVLSDAAVIVGVQAPSVADVNAMPAGSVLVSMLHGHQNKEMVDALCERKITAFGLELIPRISRAQSMDVLSSQASASGYKAALIAAMTLDKFFPMLTTAAGTIRPAQVLVIGAGVAGLQAIATAKRLGAVVEAYDVRAVTREQIESLGARFVDTGVSAEGEGGYARELSDEEKAQQQTVLEEHIAKADAVISTAAVPGRPAPRIISEAAVERMKAGAVIVDLAAESGGNCALTVAGDTIEHGGVQIVGPLNVPATVGYHASEMFARNIFNFLSPAISDGELAIDWEDEVFAKSVLTHDGEIKHAATREALEGASS